MKKCIDLFDWDYKVIGVSFKEERRMEKLYDNNYKGEYKKFMEIINKKIINFLNTRLLVNNSGYINKKENK